MREDLFEDTTRQTEAEAVFEDLIEAAYLAGIIDEQTQELKYLWICSNRQTVH